MTRAKPMNGPSRASNCRPDRWAAWLSSSARGPAVVVALMSLLSPAASLQVLINRRMQILLQLRIGEGLRRHQRDARVHALGDGLAPNRVHQGRDPQLAHLERVLDH